jgi:hypothetical protein
LASKAERLPDGTYLVEGDKATTPEYYTALALERLRIPYEFQYILWGGSQVRGGVRVDFVAYAPFAIPIEVYGEYWHTGQLGADDRMRNARVANYFKHAVEIVWGKDATTFQDALAAVRKALKR